MKALIMGSSGFIGSYLTAELKNNRYETVCCDLKASNSTITINIMNQEMIQNVLKEHKPDVLINMAGQANVGLSWKKPQLTLQLNTVGVVNILEATRLVNPRIRLILIGSSDEYGNLKDAGVNVTEDTPVKPITPYAISKQAQELFAQLYVRSYGMDICMVRMFNLGGAGQSRGYIISDFASGVADIEAGAKEFLFVGNLESKRDFTHVKDACRAVRMIAETGHTGEVYNVASGITYKARQVLDKLISMSNANIEVRQDPLKMRPSDTPVVCGSHEKLTAHTGWKPQYSLDDILSDALDYWRGQVI